MANNERIVDLVVRAKDQYSKVLANLKQQQLDLAEAGRKAQLQASIAQKTAMAGTRKELVDTQSEIKKLAADYRNLTATQGASRAEIAQLVIAKAKLQAKAGELKAALTATEQATHRLRVSQQGSFIEFARNTSALQSEAIAANGAAVALKKVEINTNAAAAAQARMANQPLARPGVSGSGGAGFCNPSDWFCNDLTLGTAANEGARAKWAYHSVQFRDDSESLDHYTRGNWGGVVSKVRADMAANAR